MNEPEKRFAEFRATPDGVAGTLIRWGDVAEIGEFTERFAAGSIDHRGDLIVNLQHDRGKPVARTGAGLELRSTDAGIEAAITWPETAPAREAKELVEARIVRGLSMEFRADKETWKGRERLVTNARLLGLALVDRPAYPGSTIAQRWHVHNLRTRKKVWF